MADMYRQVLNDLVRRCPVPLYPGEITEIVSVILTGLEAAGLEIVPVEVCDDCLEPLCVCMAMYGPAIVDVPTRGLL